MATKFTYLKELSYSQGDNIELKLNFLNENGEVYTNLFKTNKKASLRVELHNQTNSEVVYSGFHEFESYKDMSSAKIIIDPTVTKSLEALRKPYILALKLSLFDNDDKVTFSKQYYISITITGSLIKTTY